MPTSPARMIGHCLSYHQNRRYRNRAVSRETRNYDQESGWVSLGRAHPRLRGIGDRSEGGTESRDAGRLAVARKQTHEIDGASRKTRDDHVFPWREFTETTN